MTERDQDGRFVKDEKFTDEELRDYSISQSVISEDFSKMRYLQDRIDVSRVIYESKDDIICIQNRITNT